jgi:dGTPase
MTDDAQMEYLDALAHLRTPDESPWTDRQHRTESDVDPRPAFERDRDRIIHSEHFRRLQHKTQVLIVTEGDLYSTRLLHSVETAQIGRSVAVSLGLNGALADAICLAHDVGHTPFGHQGEDTLKRLLGEYGGWDSNHHSLRVIDEIEAQYSAFLGLNLTRAVREGVARHQTPYDDPAVAHGTGGDLGEYRWPSLEAQVGNVADEVAYVTHDLHDALEQGLLGTADCDAELAGSSLWKRASRKTEGEMQVSHPEGWRGVDESRVSVRLLHRNLISMLLFDVLGESARRGAAYADIAAARESETRVVDFSSDMREQVTAMREFLYDSVYKSPLVSRQNAKADHVLERLFKSLSGATRLLPTYVQQRINGSADAGTIAHEVAFFLASLTDRGALDLYGELFVPADRAMGHHVR